MLRLALDASTPQASAALGDGERLLAESVLPMRASGSEAALPEVERLLAVSGFRTSELEAVVVGAGPGSFTGVRIAASLAKGLCAALEIPLYAYSSLAAAAAGTGLDGRVCAAFDARRGQLYAAAYEDLEPPVAALGPAALTPEGLLNALGRPADWTFVGQGAVLHADRFREAGGRVLPAHLGVPRSATLLWLSARWPELGRVAEPADWEPQYVRRSGAERAVERAPAGRAAAADAIAGAGE